MNLFEAIMHELKFMNDDQKREVLDYARSLRMKEEQELDALMDSIIDENLEAFRELAK